MKLESLAIWDEKELFEESRGSDKGYRGYAKYIFEGEGITLRADRMKFISIEEQRELEELFIFLKKPEAGFLLRSLADMTVCCEDKMNDHIPYSFDRECYGFRVIGDGITWYISCTVWNERCHFTIYAYGREAIRKHLAGKRGLPDFCHGIYPFTGEQITICFGERSFLRFPQFGGNVSVNEQRVNEENKRLKVTKAQRSAMENGIIYGWDTPAAKVENYDSEGRYCPEEKEGKRK